MAAWILPTKIRLISRTSSRLPSAYLSFRLEFRCLLELNCRSVPHGVNLLSLVAGPKGIFANQCSSLGGGILFIYCTLSLHREGQREDGLDCTERTHGNNGGVSRGQWPITDGVIIIQPAWPGFACVIPKWLCWGQTSIYEVWDAHSMVLHVEFFFSGKGHSNSHVYIGYRIDTVMGRHESRFV